MDPTLYFGIKACLLDNINSNNVNAPIVKKMIRDFQGIANEDMVKLASYRDCSFIEKDWNQKTSFIKFKQFLTEIENAPSLTRFYLLAIATLNWNGYIRENAIDEITKIDKLLSLPFILMRVVDWVYEVQMIARDRLKAIFLDCSIHSLMKYGKLTDPLFFHYRPHSELIRKYFLEKYIPRQTSDDLYQCLNHLGDSEKAHILWKIIPEKKLFESNMIDLAFHLKFPRIRTIVCNRLALYEAKKRKMMSLKDK